MLKSWALIRETCFKSQRSYSGVTWSGLFISWLSFLILKLRTWGTDSTGGSSIGLHVDCPLPALHASPLLDPGGGMRAELRNDLGIIWGEVQGNISGRERVEEVIAEGNGLGCPATPVAGTGGHSWEL